MAEENTGSIGTKHPWHNLFLYTTILFAILWIFTLVIFTVNPFGFGTNTPPVVNENGTVTIFEYSDFQCSACQAAYPAVKQLLEKYGDQIDFQYQHFPLPQLHPLAQKAAEASECARDQGKFDEYYTALFEKKTLTVPDLKQHAKDLGLNSTTFDACLDNGIKVDAVEADYQEGIAKGVDATPYFFIDGKAFRGGQSFATLDQAVQEALRAADSSNSNTATQPDPEVDTIILTIAECGDFCDTAQLMDQIKTSFPTLKERIIDVSSEEGTALKNSFEINALPAIIFSDKIKETAQYAQISGALIEQNGKLLVEPTAILQATGAAYFLDVPEVGNAATRGLASSNVKIIEYSDLQCPFCRKFYEETEKKLVEEYKDQVLFAFKHYLLPPTAHPQALPSAIAIECARDQGKFWELLGKIFDEQQALDPAVAQGSYSTVSFTDTQLKDWAANVNLNMNLFNTCLADADGAKEDLINADQAEGVNFLVQGTPGIFVNHYFFGGAFPYEAIQPIIEQELAK